MRRQTSARPVTRRYPLAKGRRVRRYWCISWPPGRAGRRKILDAVAKLPVESLCHILEVGEFAGVRYVVTDPLPGARHLRQWVEAPAAPPAEALKSPPAVAKAPPGSRTASGTGGVHAAIRSRPTLPAEPHLPGQTRESEPGEFTRLFASPRAPANPPLDPGLGEFTRLFEQPASAPTRPFQFQPPPLPTPPHERPRAKRRRRASSRACSQRPSSPPRHNRSSIRACLRPQLRRPPRTTRGGRVYAHVFDTDGPRRATPDLHSGLPPVPAAPPAPEPTAAGEFTRMFSAPIAPPRPPEFHSDLPPTPAAPPAPEPRAPGEFTRMFSTPMVPAAPQPTLHSGLPPVLPAPPAPSAPQPPAASEITRKVSMQAAPPVPQPVVQQPAIPTVASPAPALPPLPQPPAPARATPAPAQISYVPLIVILAVLFRLAVALVIFFATWR